MISIDSKRLHLREMTSSSKDFKLIHEILKDPSIMYAWEHGFTKDQSKKFIEKNIKRYRSDKIGYLMVFNDEKHFIGLIGPLLEEINNKKYYGIGYILDKKYTGRGYATEGANICIDYIWKTFKVDKVVALIKTDNTPSIKVAERLNMRFEKTIDKIYRGQVMPHHVYSLGN